VVVVTGASAGVGRATAKRFGQGGASVALLARGADRLEAAAEEVREAGGEALVIPTDVSDAAAVEAAAERAEAELGPIDVWVNNAMATVFGTVDEISPEQYQQVTATTYLGTVYGTRAALQRMRPRNRGSIVQVGSALAYRGIPLQSAYCGAKFAVRGFTDSLRTELRHQRSRIRLTMVQLAAFNTPQFEWATSYLERKPRPLPPVYQPEVAARAVHWAAHHRRRELWVGTPTLKTVIGAKLAPWLADLILSREGYSGQVTEEQADADRPENLFQAPEGDYGTHGPFDQESRRHSLQLWATTNRGTLGAAVGGSLALAGLLWQRRRR
jgi:NAD(P)-dependent dehydrogenase (short-subunit alcohol dehydrogenase family)